MKPFSPRTKTYLMVLLVTLTGVAACWYLLTQINHLPDDAEAVAVLPSKHSRPDALNAKAFNFQIGKILPISDEFSIKLVSVNDSRCPSDSNVQCIWAGTVSSKLKLFQSGKLVKSVDLTFSNSTKFAGYNIEFFGVLPKQKNLKTKESDYVLTFKISS